MVVLWGSGPPVLRIGTPKGSVSTTETRNYFGSGVTPPGKQPPHTPPTRTYTYRHTHPHTRTCCVILRFFGFFRVGLFVSGDRHSSLSGSHRDSGVPVVPRVPPTPGPETRRGRSTDGKGTTRVEVGGWGRVGTKKQEEIHRSIRRNLGKTCSVPHLSIYLFLGERRLAFGRKAPGGE